LAPAVATFARQSIATLIADRTPIAELPQWIFSYGKLGLVQICGQAARSAVEVAQACAALPDASPVLHLQDLVIDPDVVTLALPEILGLHIALMGLIAVAALAIVLATAHAPLSAIVRALDLEIEGDTAGAARGARLASYVVAAAAIAASSVIAVQRPAGIVELATASTVLAAAGLFPAVVAALWWRRANSWGAVAGMLAGLGVMFLYFAGRHYFPVRFFELTAPLSSGGESGLQYFNELKDTWLSAEPGAAMDAAWAALSAHARTVADWWGISGPTTVLLALPVGFVALFIVSLLTPASRRTETAP
jgi:cation/acetate symporter